MSKRLYVGNLPFSFSSSQLKELFQTYGAIELAEVVTFKDTGRSKGFGFVTLTDDAQAEKAKLDLNNKEVGGRKIFVNDATPFDPNRPKPRFKPKFKRRFFNPSDRSREEGSQNNQNEQNDNNPHVDSSEMKSESFSSDSSEDDQKE